MSDEKETLDQETVDQETESQHDETSATENTSDNFDDKIDESESNKDIDNLSDEEFLNYLDQYYKDDSLRSKTHDNANSNDSVNTDKNTANIRNENTKIGSDSSNNTPDEDPNSETSKNDQDNQVIDYKAEYEKIFKPFKANGKEITPKTADDVISLMQKGAGFTKKMQLLSPYRKAVDTLQKHNISEEDLSYLIDLRNGNKEAIKTLLKEKNIDLMDLDLDDVQYTKNKNNLATDSEVQFNDTLRDINDSLPQISDIMNNKWDAESKKILLTDQRALRGLHEEIQMGRFDTIQAMVDRERTFGRYQGVPDIQLYSMFANDYVKQQQHEQQLKQQAQQEAVQNQEKQAKRAESKKKAAPTGKTASKGKNTLTIKDLLSMPEEEFLKLSERNLV